MSLQGVTAVRLCQIFSLQQTFSRGVFQTFSFSPNVPLCHPVSELCGGALRRRRRPPQLALQAWFRSIVRYDEPEKERREGGRRKKGERQKFPSVAPLAQLGRRRRPSSSSSSSPDCLKFNTLSAAPGGPPPVCITLSISQPNFGTESDEKATKNVYVRLPINR